MIYKKYQFSDTGQPTESMQPESSNRKKKEEIERSNRKQKKEGEHYHCPNSLPGDFLGNNRVGKTNTLNSEFMESRWLESVKQNTREKVPSESTVIFSF